MTQQDVLDYIRKTPHNSNVNVVKGMLDSLGGSSLPEVTNEDNGKVLTVVEGEWDKAAGGGAEPLVVNFSPSTEPGKAFVLDKTWQEIDDAFPLVYVEADFEGATVKFNVLLVGYSEDNGYRLVTAPILGSDNEQFSVDEDGYPYIDNNA